MVAMGPVEGRVRSWAPCAASPSLRRTRLYRHLHWRDWQPGRRKRPYVGICISRRPWRAPFRSSSVRSPSRWWRHGAASGRDRQRHHQLHPSRRWTAPALTMPARPADAKGHAEADPNVTSKATTPAGQGSDPGIHCLPHLRPRRRVSRSHHQHRPISDPRTRWVAPSNCCRFRAHKSPTKVRRGIGPRLSGPGTFCRIRLPRSPGASSMPWWSRPRPRAWLMFYGQGAGGAPTASGGDRKDQ